MIPFQAHPTALVESEAIGPGTRIWAFAHVLPGAVIGRDCNIGDHAYIDRNVRIGDRVTVKNGVAIWEHVTVEDDVFLGPYAVLTNDLRPRSRQPWRPVATRISQGATVGANATVLCGTTLGRYCLISAGSVVTRDVPDFALIRGNPGRVAGAVCVCAQPLVFVDGAASCARCGQAYQRWKDVIRPTQAGEADGR